MTTISIDLHTTIVVSATTMLLIGLVLLLYGLRGRFRWAPAAWGLADMLHAGAMILPTRSGYANNASLIMVANSIDLGALALLWSGTAHFRGVRRPLPVLLAPKHRLGSRPGAGRAPAGLVRRADHALYLGKRNGRNRVEVG